MLFCIIFICYLSGSTSVQLYQKSEVGFINIGKCGPNFYFANDSNINLKNLKYSIKLF